MLTITVVCDVLGTANNGVTIAAINLIKYLKSTGNTVKVLCSDEEKRGQNGYYIVPHRDFGIFNDYLAKNGVTLAKPIRQIIVDSLTGSDIVHIMLPFSLGRASEKIAKELNIPVSAGFHLLAQNFSTHVFLSHSLWFNRAVYAYFHTFYKDVDNIHYVTDYVRDVYEGMYGETNGEVISNGVNEIFKPSGSKQHNDPLNKSPNNVINILYTGRYSKEKSHKVLINAVKHSKYKDRIKLILAGTGPLLEKLEKKAEDLPIAPTFNFFTREQMVEANHSAYLYVHAAEFEAEGIGCLEAMACGVVPVISNSPKCATRFYALTEQSLFDHSNEKNLAAKIDWWIEHPEQRAEYSAKYAANAREKFDHVSCMQRMEEMLIQTVERYNRPKAE